MKTFYIIFMPGYDAHEIFFEKLKPGQPKGFIAFLREEIEKAGFEIKFSTDASNLENFGALLSWELTQAILNNITKYPRQKCALMTFEPPIILPYYYNPQLKRFFGSIFLATDQLVDNKNIFRIQTYSREHLKFVDPLPPFSERKFCNVMNSNNSSNQPGEEYSERKQMVNFFKNIDDFDVYGRGWNGIKSWKGEIPGDDKWDVLIKYKFTICYENSTPDGYVTERLADAFSSGCIPVYLGPENIEELIPKSCFINRKDFKSYNDLYQYMKNIDESTYQTYLKNFRKFFDSPQVQSFSSDYLAKRIVERIVG